MDMSRRGAAEALGVACAGLAYVLYKRSNMLDRDWFSELGSMWPGQAFSLKVANIVEKKRSKFQDLIVFDSTDWGRVLVLDGVIQCTDRDEHAYQEMLSHPALFAQPQPRKVLVIGGGDGGVVREICKHSSVTEVHLCEIDEEVINISKRHLPHMACGFEDPRVHVHIEDGAAYLERHSNTFDVIICDTSDPVGPAETLFSHGFYDSIEKALTPDGVACTQGECMWLHQELIKDLISYGKTKFADVKYLSMSIPTYPCGQIGALICCKGKSRVLSPRPCDLELKYYDTDVHKAAAVLPKFAQRALYGA